MKKRNVSIDDFFKLDSNEVARLLIGMEIVRKDDEGIYVVTKTKPYHGETRHSTSMPRMHRGSIMMFNIRGHPHTCIATGICPEQDYVFINSLIERDIHYKAASEASRALGLGFENNGDRFADYFRLRGVTKDSTFTRSRKAEASSCLGVYELKK